MEFQTKLLLLSFAITIVFGMIVLPILKKLKVGQIERNDGPESHLKKQGTPTMGGIIIMLGIIAVTIGTYIYYRTKDVELAQKLLNNLVSNGIKVSKFELKRPTLNDIFIEKVGE